MEIYLVGGAVRDELLGLPVKERDWVVVGATPEHMLRLGYRQVGRDFPVFLHPSTNEEYALARTERKVAPGHTGFVCHAGPDVTLEQDLMRRDLTINAIAKRTNGALVDPWHGRRDLDARLLRHVSRAFVEDPLRVFRVARFAARFGRLGFTVTGPTLDLMRRMAGEGALRELAPERIAAELAKALEADSPSLFFDVLRVVNALEDWFVEVTPTATATLARVAPLLDGAARRFAALGWDTEPTAAHELTERLKLPREWQDAIETVARDGRALARYVSLDAETLFAHLKRAGALRRVATFERVVDVVSAASSVSLSPIRSLGEALRGVSSASLRADGLAGKALGDALDRVRAEIVKAFLAEARGGAAPAGGLGAETLPDST